MLNVSNSDIGIEIVFTDSVIKLFMDNRRGLGENEYGGHLFSKPEISDSVIVSDATLPHKKDKSGPTFFKPHQQSSQKTIDDYFKKNLAYMGDWHTHSNSRPYPSPQDFRTIRNVYTESRHDLVYMLMVIIGTSDNFSENYFCLTNGKDIFDLKVNNNRG